MDTEAPPAQASRVRGYGLMPEDARQALGLRRFATAAGTALLMPLILLVAAALGLADYLAGWLALAIVAGFIALFYTAFRSGLNLRFRDQSLTGEQILAAILCTALICYFSGAARPAIAMFYLVALLFGALRLNAIRLLVLALIALLAHAAALYSWQLRHPGADATGAAIELVALGMVLPWFALMGAYVHGLRARLSDSHRRLQSAFKRMEEIAVRDELTGVFNRRFLMESLARERSRATRLAAPFSICLSDIDHFKSINDRLGHAAGDGVLKHFALISAAGLRATDIFGRYGGEEFLMILPDTGLNGARTVAERARKAIETADFPQVANDQRVTVTSGVASSKPAESVPDLLARADKGLYDGKAAGRNQVVAVG